MSLLKCTFSKACYYLFYLFLILSILLLIHLLVETANASLVFATYDEVFLVGDFRTPRNTRRTFTMVRGEGETARTKFELSVDFKQPQG